MWSFWLLLIKNSFQHISHFSDETSDETSQEEIFTDASEVPATQPESTSVTATPSDVHEHQASDTLLTAPAAATAQTYDNYLSSTWPRPSWREEGVPEGSVCTEKPPTQHPFPQTTQTEEELKIISPLQRDVKKFLMKRIGKLKNLQMSCPDIRKTAKDKPTVVSARYCFNFHHCQCT